VAAEIKRVVFERLLESVPGTLMAKIVRNFYREKKTGIDLDAAILPRPPSNIKNRVGTET
jgi:hypothetical protein